MGTGHTDLLQSILRSNDGFMAVLRAARAADLPEWFVGAGAVRSTVWDYLHGYTVPTPLADVDVAFFDPRDLTPARDAAATALLAAHGPGLPWEATNQAAVHLWYPAVFGAVVAPVFSSDEAIGTWPETATCVGVRLLADDSLVVAAPHGLDDLLTRGAYFSREQMMLLTQPITHAITLSASSAPDNIRVTDWISYAVGGISIIAAAIFGYIFYKRAERIKKPVWLIKTNVIQNSASRIDGMEVLYEGNAVSDLSVSEVSFWNDGKEPVQGSDVEADRIFIEVVPPAKILSVKKMEEKGRPSGLNIVCDLDQTKASIDFRYLNHLQGGKFQIIHTGVTSQSLKMHGSGVGFNGVEPAKKKRLSVTTNKIMLAISFLSALVGLIGNVAYPYFNSQHMTHQADAVLIVEASLLIGLIIILLAFVLLSYSKAIRIDRDTKLERALRQEMRVETIDMLEKIVAANVTLSLTYHHAEATNRMLEELKRLQAAVPTPVSSADDTQNDDKTP